MSIEELRAFLAVAEHQSFVGAANALGVARTSLRRQVDALEARTGVALLERGHAGVVLTEAGRVLVERGRAIERDFSTLMSSVREVGSAPSGLVRALLPVGVPHRMVASVIAMARSAWPGIRPHIRFSDAPLSAPLTDVDLVAWFGLDTPTGAWSCHTFVPAPMRLIAIPSYLRTHGTPRTLDDLERHELYVWSAHPMGHCVITRAGEAVPVQATLSSTHVDLLYDCVYRGLGLAWVPDGGVPEQGGSEPHVGVMDDVLGAPMELRLAAPTALATTSRVAAFLSNLPRVRSAAHEPIDDY